MPTNNHHIVEGSIERVERRTAVDRTEQRMEWGMALAAILQSIPKFVWAAPVVLIFGFIILAVAYQHDHLGDFTSSVLIWLSRILIAVGIVLVVLGIRWCYRFYHTFVMEGSTRRTARHNEKKALESARAQELKNELLQADIKLRQQIPRV